MLHGERDRSLGGVLGDAVRSVASSNRRTVPGVAAERVTAPVVVSMPSIIDRHAPPGQ